MHSEWNKIFGAALAALAFMPIAGACGGATTASRRATSPTAEHVVPTTFADQVEWGAQLYGEHCASCHGSAGQGAGRAPRLVGLAAGALPIEPRARSTRTAHFVTVADVAGFAVANMPPRAPRSLTADAYWAILAFDLSANGLTLDAPLTPECAATLTIPR